MKYRLILSFIFLVLFFTRADAQRFVGQSASTWTGGTTLSEDQKGLVDGDGDLIVWKAGVLADGDFSKAISGEDKAARTGSLGISAVKTREDVPILYTSFSVNLGSGQDTIFGTFDPETQKVTNESLFGNILLLPGSASKAAQSLTSSLLVRPWAFTQKDKHNFFETLGFFGYMNSANVTLSDGVVTDNARIMASALGLQYDAFVLPKAEGENGNDVALSVFAGFALRHISGDIRTNNDLRDRLLETRARWFPGLEAGAIFSVNSLRLTANFPYFGKDIKGFSNGQFIVSLGFSTSLNAAIAKYRKETKTKKSANTE